ncbi:S-adenosyl-L-methionine-dependent methyltransferase [Delitschia confertaspora ATCC 74209]|uniref:S-adenosyl-L-methionine-dependent methyltransferase n=1 Tax=Delitschia confertaspora ATCC 74209 TaxID=1513339 RepID=A0A9P4JNE7_9PLEO|nr:S-adenosyl-L-methionine-dependent methyltransferase [Delitschia confertaspora ATCC 74209]
MTMASQNQDRLRSHFTNVPEPSHPSRWDDLWRASDFLPWDRGFPNPALYDTLISHSSTFGSPLKANGKRKRALVPGCGKGYDLVLLSAFGYDAYGVEYSEHAVRAAEEWLAGWEKDEKGKEFYGTRDEKVGRGVYKCVYGDFFKNGWVETCGGSEGGFDLIYDCTFLSALPPSLRPSWAHRMTQLLAPEGHLICLEFPTKKPPKSGGPPWALPPVVYEELLVRPGEEIQYDDEGKVVETERKEMETALRRIDHWQPARTHDVGKGTDWVSIWSRKGV